MEGLCFVCCNHILNRVKRDMSSSSKAPPASRKKSRVEFLVKGHF